MALTKKDFLSGVAVIVYQDAASARDPGAVPALKFYGVDESGRVYEGEQTAEQDRLGEKVSYHRSPVPVNEVVAECVFVGMDYHPFPLKSV